MGRRAKTWTTCLMAVGLALTAGRADADGVVIASGAKGGYYHAVARGLGVLLRSEYGIATDVLSTGGSMQNLAELADPDSLVNVALVQADALQSFLADHEDFVHAYVQLSDAGKECAFIVTHRESGITSLDALAGEGERTIAIGDPGSGAAVTWANMTRLRPALTTTQPVEQGVIESLLGMRTGQPGAMPVAAMMVQRPTAVATPLEIVLQNKTEYVLVPIRESDLETKDRHARSTGYSYEKVVVGFGRDYQTSVDTICTRALIIAAKNKISVEDLKAVEQAIDKSRRYIMPEGR